jgi:hypothetical protein
MNVRKITSRIVDGIADIINRIVVRFFLDGSQTASTEYLSTSGSF